MGEEKDLDLREYQLVLLGILKDVAEVCRKHEIRFYLGEGSLLGAIRHDGFIPWDDDIDILMYRADYEKFLSLAPAALGDAYEVQAPGITKPFWHPYAQVRLITDDAMYFLVSNGIQEIRENGFGRENIPAMMAAVVVISLPLIVLFLIFRKKIMEGVSRGGTKG